MSAWSIDWCIKTGILANVGFSPTDHQGLVSRDKVSVSGNDNEDIINTWKPTLTCSAGRTMLLRNSGQYKLKTLFCIRKSVTARFLSSQKTADPLRILFCGSDDFSITSLKALYDQHKQDTSLIASINVVCRPGKRVGRGLKTLREVPIAEAARSLSIPVHEVDTFTGWTPPPTTPQGEPINLVIAVSFGRLVPPRILNGAKYAGLNVHPSLLPDFHGPAPLHHTLLHNCARTGVTLQTMHPQHFDQGVILDQTPFPGVEHHSMTVAELSSKMAPLGAEMLVSALRNHTFVSPHEVKGWLQAGHDGLSRPAPKITSEDSHIDWTKWTADEILQRQDIVGPLWNTIHPPVLDSQGGKREQAQKPRRVIWSFGFSKAASTSESIPTEHAGMPYPHPYLGDQSVIACININTIDRQTLQATTVKLDGERERSAAAAMASLLGEKWGLGGGVREILS